MADRMIHATGTIGMILASISTLALGGCGEKQQPANESVPAPVKAIAEPVLPIPLPVPLPVLTRRDLIVAAAAATDAVAAGAAVAPNNAALLGRRFEVRLPFGCNGPAPADETQWAGWTINAGSGALKLSARSELSAEDPWLRAIAGGAEFEAAEGFWMRRPWTAAETCPAQPDSAPEPGETQTLALVQLFAAEAPRTRQRGGRPYTSTIKLSDEGTEGPRTFRLLLEGRVTGFADRQPVHCSQSSASARPRCAIAVEFTRLAFEDADARIMAEWRY